MKTRTIVVTLSLLTLLILARPGFLSAIQANIVALFNYDPLEQTANLYSELAEDATLENAAQMKADDMAFRSYFAHTDREGKTVFDWLNEQNYQYQSAAEQLFVKFDGETTWTRSPEQLVNEDQHYSHIGTGISTGKYQDRQVTFVVQFFANPKN